jgi:hypothetical protein
MKTHVPDWTILKIQNHPLQHLQVPHRHSIRQQLRPTPATSIKQRSHPQPNFTPLIKKQNFLVEKRHLHVFTDATGHSIELKQAKNRLWLYDLWLI